MATGWMATQLFLVLLFGSLPRVSCQGTTPSVLGMGLGRVIPTLISSPPESPAAAGLGGQGAGSGSPGAPTRSKHLNPNVCGVFANMRQMLDRQAQSTDITQTSTCQRLCQGGIAPSMCNCRYRANPCTVYRCPGGTGCTLEMCSGFLLPVCVPWDVLYKDLAANPDAVCSLPPDAGSCPGSYYTRYYFDQGSETCHQFRYSGCGGNANSFTTLNGCRQVCGRSRPSPPQVTSTRLSSSRITALQSGTSASTNVNTNVNTNTGPDANANRMNFLNALSNIVRRNNQNSNQNTNNNNSPPMPRMATPAGSTENPMIRLMRNFNNVAAARRARMQQNGSASAAAPRGSSNNQQGGLTPWQQLMMGQTP